MSPLQISELVIEGLRGCPRPLTLALRGKSLCLIAENGCGKTTIADAVELWSTGDLASFHSEGCALDAAIHLDSSVATVTVTGSGFSHRRTLDATGIKELEPLAPSASSAIESIPILRHSTIAAFMGATAGEKKKALLELLGIGGLNGLRDPLRTSAGHAKRDAEAALRSVAAEKAAVKSQLAGEAFVAYAEARRLKARLDAPIASPSDVLELELSATGAPADPAGAVDRLAAALVAGAPSPVAAWNALVADDAVIRADATADLLRAAQRAIDPLDQSCPVCEQPIVGTELSERLATRAAALRTVRVRFSEVEAELAALESQLTMVSEAIADLLRSEPSGGWEEAGELRASEAALTEQITAIGTARTGRSSAPPIPDLQTLHSMLPRLRELASSQSRSAQTQSLVELTELRQKYLRLGRAERLERVTGQAYSAVRRILEIADEEIEQSISAAVARLSSLTADYYGRLVRGSPITDVKLVYRKARSGQLEFSLTFDGRHRGVTPPQRIMSTSQLNALGLALHLARLKLDEDVWRTMFLDDLVNSFDASHRQGLARLLVDEFADWQLIALTHDRAFEDILRRTVKGWSFKEIIAFSPSGGPQLSDGDPRVALRERLDNGASAMEAAHLARRALEQGLSTPLYRLAYAIRFDPDQRYTAQDYLRALRAGFKRSKSPLKDLAVLRRMDADSYMSNLGVHHRIDSSALTTDDLYRLADDLDELDRELNCGVCEEPVWRTHRSAGSGESFQCGCGALAA
jgi:recombinational DNA repair ATPase RecF